MNCGFTHAQFSGRLLGWSYFTQLSHFFNIFSCSCPLFFFIFSTSFNTLLVVLNFAYVFVIVVPLILGWLPNHILNAPMIFTDDCSSWYVSTIKTRWSIVYLLIFAPNCQFASVLNMFTNCIKILFSKLLLWDCVIKLLRYIQRPPTTTPAVWYQNACLDYLYLILQNSHAMYTETLCSICSLIFFVFGTT